MIYSVLYIKLDYKLLHFAIQMTRCKNLKVMKIEFL